MARKRPSRNAPCPCGSGKKYKHCCYGTDVERVEGSGATEHQRRRAGARRPPSYPMGTVALYGPDDQTTTKIAAGVILHGDAQPIIKRWVSTDILNNAKVQQQLHEFFAQYGVKSVAVSDGNMGCPHEEGPDFPVGEDCPFCPFWRGKQGSNRRE